MTTMLEDLENEVEAMNSIYGDGTLQLAADDAGSRNLFVLRVPDADTSLKIEFPNTYPGVPPLVLGTHSSGEHTRRGDAAHVLEVLQESITRLFHAGEVCLYDVIEDVTSSLTTDVPKPAGDAPEDSEGMEPEEHAIRSGPITEAPPWTISDVVIELKSVFVARCAPVHSPEQARQYLQYLLNTDRKVAKATHNITAHRIQAENGVTFQDCDDDGETAAGSRLLHLMQVMDLWNVTVVVTRWYGGQKLGPARFGIINTVARNAFVKAGFVQDQDSSKKKKKRQ